MHENMLNMSCYYIRFLFMHLFREKYRHMKAQTCLAIAVVGLLAMLYFRFIAKGGAFQIFSPREHDFSHSFTINFSNGNLYKGNAFIIYG